MPAPQHVSVIQGGRSTAWEMVKGQHLEHGSLQTLSPGPAPSIYFKVATQEDCAFAPKCTGVAQTLSLCAPLSLSTCAATRPDLLKDLGQFPAPLPFYQRCPWPRQPVCRESWGWGAGAGPQQRQEGCAGGRSSLAWASHRTWGEGLSGQSWAPVPSWLQSMSFG